MKLRTKVFALVTLFGAACSDAPATTSDEATEPLLNGVPVDTPLLLAVGTLGVLDASGIHPSCNAVLITPSSVLTAAGYCGAGSRAPTHFFMGPDADRPAVAIALAGVRTGEHVEVHALATATDIRPIPAGAPLGTADVGRVVSIVSYNIFNAPGGGVRKRWLGKTALRGVGGKPFHEVFPRYEAFSAFAHARGIAGPDSELRATYDETVPASEAWSFGSELGAVRTFVLDDVGAPVLDVDAAHHLVVRGVVVAGLGHGSDHANSVNAFATWSGADLDATR